MLIRVVCVCPICGQHIYTLVTDQMVRRSITNRRVCYLVYIAIWTYCKKYVCIYVMRYKYSNMYTLFFLLLSAKSWSFRELERSEREEVNGYMECDSSSCGIWQWSTHTDLKPRTFGHNQAIDGPRPTIENPTKVKQWPRKERKSRRDGS